MIVVSGANHILTLPVRSSCKPKKEKKTGDVENGDPDFARTVNRSTQSCGRSASSTWDVSELRIWLASMST
jgi:hypothetical protein